MCIFLFSLPFTIYRNIKVWLVGSFQSLSNLSVVLTLKKCKYLSLLPLFTNILVIIGQKKREHIFNISFKIFWNLAFPDAGKGYVGLRSNWMQSKIYSLFKTVVTCTTFYNTGGFCAVLLSLNGLDHTYSLIQNKSIDELSLYF